MTVVRATLTLEVITDNTNELKEKTIILADLNKLSLKELKEELNAGLRNIK